jgi:hypothetical protein
MNYKNIKRKKLKLKKKMKSMNYQGNYNNLMKLIMKKSNIKLSFFSLELDEDLKSILEQQKKEYEEALSIDNETINNLNLKLNVNSYLNY